MANRDIPSGFTQIQSKNPSCEPFVSTRVVGGSAAVYKGALVDVQTDGTVDRTANTTITTAITDGTKALALNGGAVGESIQVILDLTSITAEIQCAANGITSDVRGQLYDVIVAADNSTTEQSGIELEDVTGVPGAVVRVTDMVDRADNDVTLANNKVRVEFV